ncbi:uncharacterized protein LOC126184047 [Schistocerca cancellata]|uniref:uncharacterized protein LOC126184047 n=1 Tax=Schistocerca cancellata TaxID=274614 RepID=UPI0021186B26|nr:uncharacterized protein LOC126184047 [Schistocerca cancellata]
MSDPYSFICTLFGHLHISKFYPADMKLFHDIPNRRGTEQETGTQPTALVSVFSKVIETLMKHRITNIIEKFDIFSANQHRFCKGLSTESAISHFTENIIIDLDRHSSTIPINLDLQQ